MGGKAGEDRPRMRKDKPSAGALPEKYKCIVRAAVCLAIGRYGFAEEEASEALRQGATGWELAEGLLSSSSGWRMLH